MMRTPEIVIARKIFNDYLGRFEINNIHGEKITAQMNHCLNKLARGGGGGLK